MSGRPVRLVPLSSLHLSLCIRASPIPLLAPLLRVPLVSFPPPSPRTFSHRDPRSQHIITTNMAPSVAAADVIKEHGPGLKQRPNVPHKAAPVSPESTSPTALHLEGRSADDTCQAEEEMLVLNTIRCLAADLCQQVSTEPQSSDSH
jgi:hypothetical protein